MSMRTLNRRLLRWRRYAHRTAWNPRITQPAWCGPDTAITPGHTRAWDAREKERERRQCFPRYALPCFDCGLPDFYGGRGDGIGSCECPRCRDCGAPPEGCTCGCCHDEEWGEEYWDEPPVRPVETIDTGGLL